MIDSDGDDRSVLAVNVYKKHRFEKDVLVGNLSDTISGVLGKLKAGGTRMVDIHVLLMRALRSKCLKTLFARILPIPPIFLGLRSSLR